jgi:hypothetical protein
MPFCEAVLVAGAPTGQTWWEEGIDRFQAIYAAELALDTTAAIAVTHGPADFGIGRSVS